MKLTRARIIQIISMFVVQMLTLFILPNFLSGFTYDSFRSFLLTIVLAITQSLFWWCYLPFSRLLYGFSRSLRFS
jgi:hypothetical protein